MESQPQYSELGRFLWKVSLNILNEADFYGKSASIC